ncbi:MAG: CRISPR-associated endonuclease Cas3'' [Pseudomonadota bacterium]
MSEIQISPLARPGQLLADHLKGVAQQAETFASVFHGQNTARIAEILHDLGKCRREFQKYLKGVRKAGIDTHHAIYGAALAAENGWDTIAFVIAGHHAGLHDAHARIVPLVKWVTVHRFRV